MKHVLMQIGKHSSIYMFSQIVTNGLSVLMLPIYLNYFTPQDFGCMAVIELGAGLLTAALVHGIISAVTRYHFEAKCDSEQQLVWWTGYLFILGTLSAGCLALYLGADRLSQFVLGPEFPSGSLWIQLATLSLWLDIQINVVYSYFRAKKRSTQIVGQTLARSAIFLCCAIPAITYWRFGLTSMFASHVIASSILFLVNFSLIFKEWGLPRVSRILFLDLWRYGWPLLLIGVLMNVMHGVNRVFVERWISMEQVGLLSLGIQVADKVNRLIVMPFEQIWGMLVYELHEENPREAIRTFCFMFELFCYILISVFFGCSVSAGPVFKLIARPEYLSSVPLVPILCLAQFCFSLNYQFQVPMRLFKQTYLIFPAAIAGTATAILMNWWLVSQFGVYGAAWATVATYACFSAVNLMIARKLADYPYPLVRIGLVLAGACALFAGLQVLHQSHETPVLALLAGLTAWLIGTIGMGVICYQQMRQETSAELSATVRIANPS